MYYKAHIRFVDAHAKSNSCHYHINFFKKKRILIFSSGSAVHAGMIWQSLNVVHTKRFGKFFNFLAAKAIDYPRFARTRFYITYNLFVDFFCFWAHLIIKVRAIKRRFEHSYVGHAQIFLYVVLHFWRCRGGECNHWTRSYFVYFGTNVAILRAKIMPPFRNAMGFVNCKKRYLHSLQELYVFILG